MILVSEADAARPRVIITGISRGIGRATALAYADLGARVAGIHRGTEPGISAELSREILARGGEPLIEVGDASSTEDVQSLADAVVNRWGGIDIWINNAARLLVRPFLEMTDEDWAELLESNLMGYVRGARAASRHMVAAGAGSIVNISSAVDPFPPADMTAYVTAKGGIGGLTRSLAVELGPFGIRVNAVAPGATETPLNTEAWSETVRSIYRDRIPLRRIATPEEIADFIVAIASEKARYVTGQVILVDGGLTLNGSVGHKRS